MNDVFLKWDAPVTNPPERGAFLLEEDNTRMAEMVFRISGANMTVFHTEVDPSLQGKGVSTKLFNMMVSYARENNLKVIPLCAYVLAQFQRHPDQYADIWKKK
jgi:predicted GNAT family acetyltransferase